MKSYIALLATFNLWPTVIGPLELLTQSDAYIHL